MFADTYAKRIMSGQIKGAAWVAMVTKAYSMGLGTPAGLATWNAWKAANGY